MKERAKPSGNTLEIIAEPAEVSQRPQEAFHVLLDRWISKNPVRRRMAMQAQAKEEFENIVGTPYQRLVAISISVYAKRFLPGFQVLYTCHSNGRKVTSDEEEQLMAAGITIGSADRLPDVLLWNRATDYLWCIEIVTRVGEADIHKVLQIQKMAKRCGKAGVKFTTIYQTWKATASRQDAMKNLAIGTYLWIVSDPSRQFKVQSFETEMLEFEVNSMAE